MRLNETIISEFQNEAKSTRKMLERVPEDKHFWKPHEKSMTLGELATHVAELPLFAISIVEQDELDFLTLDYKPKVAKTNAELLQIFEENLSSTLESLKNATDEKLLGNWRLRSGEKIFFEMPRIEVLRFMVLNHIVHHRGQLSVFLRLQNVPLPGVYGPTADEPNM